MKHLNLRGKESMASKIVIAVEIMLNRKTDGTIVEETVEQKHLDQSAHSKSVSGGITNDVDHNANTTEEVEYPGMTKATGEVTILDKNISTNSIETNRNSDRIRKIPQTSSNDFLWVN